MCEVNQKVHIIEELQKRGKRTTRPRLIEKIPCKRESIFFPGVLC